jgi:hypothetical protein
MLKKNMTYWRNGCWREEYPAGDAVEVDEEVAEAAERFGYLERPDKPESEELNPQGGATDGAEGGEDGHDDGGDEEKGGESGEGEAEGPEQPKKPKKGGK